jgi:hypothetical protein
MAPATAEQIAAALGALAGVFGAPAPEGAAFKLYVAALHGVSIKALRLGVVEVTKTHRFPTMPLPADILRACEAPQNVLRLLRDRTQRALAMLP